MSNLQKLVKYQKSSWSFLKVFFQKMKYDKARRRCDCKQGHRGLRAACVLRAKRSGAGEGDGKKRKEAGEKERREVMAGGATGRPGYTAGGQNQGSKKAKNERIHLFDLKNDILEEYNCSKSNFTQVEKMENELQNLLNSKKDGIIEKENSNSDEIVTEFAYGFELKSYRFEKYKSKKNLDIQKIDITSKNSDALKKKKKKKKKNKKKN